LDIQFFGGTEEDGKVFVVETKIDAGYFIDTHKHNHAHLSVLVSGVADVTIDKVTTRISGYKIITVPKNSDHTVAAVTDVIWLCLWSEDQVSHKETEEALKLVKTFNDLGD